MDWPEDLTELVRGEVFQVEGGHEYDGRPIVPFDEKAVRSAARWIRDLGLRSVAVASVFSPLKPDCEERAAEILREESGGELDITLSKDLGRIGLLGRENAMLLNVSMDMWEPYITVVGKKAPQARVIFDRFHIVKHLNEAVDKTRRELVRELKGTARRNLKNTKFPLLKAKHNRSAKDKRVLREQVRANRRLYRAMLLRDDFMDLYTYKTETWAKKFLRGWLRRAMSSRIEPVKRAAKMIRSHFDGVIAWVTWRLSNGRLEGMNNKIRLLSHRSFGLHSAEALISLVYLNCGGLTLERIH